MLNRAHKRGPRKPLPAFADLPDDAFVRRKQFIPNPLPISAATLWRWIRDGKFPAPEDVNGLPMWRARVIREALKEAA
jgi:prophage regulatory protein